MGFENSIQKVPLILAKVDHIVPEQHSLERDVNVQKLIQNMKQIFDKSTMDNILLPMF